jgi:endonuclease YncB( thermonuclease family)
MHGLKTRATEDMEADEKISAWLRRRRLLKIGAWSLLVLVLVWSFLDHTRAFGYFRSDSRRFDRRSAVVTRAIDGDTICVRVEGDDNETTVHLLGVDAPDLPGGHWSDRAAKYTAARTDGRTVTLRLDPVGWRNDRGELLAYVFITDADNLNLDLIRDGQGYADRRTKHSLHAPFEAAEKEARQKQRGLWKEVTDDQQPQWRREWLKSRGY